MDSPRHTPRLGFWIATTFVIIVTVFLVIIRGAGPGNGGGLAADLWITVGLVLIPGSCVGLVQVFMMAYSSMRERIKWCGITVVGIVIGWCVVFALMNFLAQLQSLPTIGDQLVPAAFHGLLMGTLIGAIIGLVTGVIQGSVQGLLARQWITGNLISWSIGIAVSLAVLFAAISQISFSF